VRLRAPGAAGADTAGEAVAGGGGAAPRGRVAGRAFAAVTLAPALVAVAWLVPGTALLLAGRLVAVPLVVIWVPFAAALCYFAWRRLPDRWVRFGGAVPAAAAAGRKACVPAGALLLMVAIAGGFAVWQAFFRSEPVFTADGPGLYLQYGAWIAGHGTARVPVSAGSFGGAAGLRFATTGFTVSGGSFTPAALPGLPLVLAGGAWLGGLGGALLMPAVLGGCAVLSFGGLVGRVCGAWQAVAAELVLALCLPEVYTARAPFSEPLVQVLLLGGLCLLVDGLAVRARDGGGGLALALLGGVALGLTTLASPFAVGLLLPTLPVLVLLCAARRLVAGVFGLGLVAGLGIGLCAGLVLAPSYLVSLAGQLRPVGWCAVGFGVAAVLAVPLVSPRLRVLVRRVCAANGWLPWFRGARLVLPSLGAAVEWLAMVLPAIFFVWLAERPYLRGSGWLGVGQPAGSAGAARAGVSGEDGLYWAAWYVGVPALLAAGAGAASLGRQAVAAALQPRALAAGSGLRQWGVPLLVIFWSGAVLWEPSVGPWQPAASRSLVPLVLPGVVLLAVWTASWLVSLAGGLGASRKVVAVVGAFCLLAIGGPPVVTTLYPSLTGQPPTGREAGGGVWVVRLRGAGTAATGRGSVAAAASLCASIGPSASVLFTDQATAARYAPVVRGQCGKPAAVLAGGASGGASGVVAQAARAIHAAGRRAVLLGPTRASVSLGGGVARRVVWLRTSGDAETLGGAPAGTATVTYTLWLAVPAVTAGGVA
jgi:hypothetical protein